MSPLVALVSSAGLGALVAMEPGKDLALVVGPVVDVVDLGVVVGGKVNSDPLGGRMPKTTV